MLNKVRWHSECAILAYRPNGTHPIPNVPCTSEVSTITTEMETLKQIIQEMTNNPQVLGLLDQGIVEDIWTLIPPPCEDPNPW